MPESAETNQYQGELIRPAHFASISMLTLSLISGILSIALIRRKQNYHFAGRRVLHDLPTGCLAGTRPGDVASTGYLHLL